MRLLTTLTTRLTMRDSSLIIRAPNKAAGGLDMDYWQSIQELVERVSQGETPTTLEGLKILHSNGAEYTAYMAGAHHLKELAYGDTAQLCSIINAKSGRCMENCSFCAQSAHHQSSPPVYPLKSREEIIEGARIAQEEGSHCYGIVTSGTQPSFGDEFDTVLSSITEIRARFDVEPSASLGLLFRSSRAAAVMIMPLWQ